jgi:predicted AlkP superfamily phosphohydrolase/phosphomutase
MSLPRWTVYPALVLIAVLVVMAVPRTSQEDPYAGAAIEAALARNENRPAQQRRFRHEPLVIVGVDGMDPDILAEVVERFPDDMPNFRWLIGAADGIQSLGTSCPPQSPVAWSNFITGLDPGGHGIFDFIHRDPVTREPASSTTRTESATVIPLPGAWQFQLGGDSPSNRTGKAFWTILKEHGVPADIWRMPANFPVEDSLGLSFSGMMTPALDSAYGQCTFFTTDPARKESLSYEKVERVTEWDGKIQASISGPPNPFKEGNPHGKAGFTVLVDRENGAAAFDVGSDKLVLCPGQWSDFVRLDFDLLPLGAMNMSGIVRFYLRAIDPAVEFYVSPVNFDPSDPAVPVSGPDDASAELAEAIGLYYTQGMAEDVNALKEEVLTDAEFMMQAELVYDESLEMLDYALDQYLEDDQGGLLFFYFSTVDLCSHMMWRHFDAAHPAHDAALAAESSAAWSGRAGSTWRETIYDLYRKIDPALGTIRERLGDGVTLLVISDHGFAPYRREFDLNRWLWEHGYLVLNAGQEPEQEPGGKKVFVFDGSVDWSKTRAYGMGFNGLYVNKKGRELDNRKTPADESGIVDPGAETQALLRQIKAELEALEDPETGLRAILRCDIAAEVYHGARLPEAPDMLIGFNAGYGNSDAASTGRITHAVFLDNDGGTFNGSHLMAPEVVPGLLLTNRPVRQGQHRLEDLTAELLRQYGIEKPAELRGHPVLE